MRFLVALSLLLAAMGTSVGAADLGGDNKISLKDEPRYLSRFDWTGTYGGVQLGYGWADTEADTNSPNNAPETHDYDSDGFIGGLHAGYNLQRQRLVYGIEADIDFTDLDATGAGSRGNNLHQTEIYWTGSLRARVGLAADRTLFYMTGGWAFGEVDTTLSSADDGAILASNSEVRHGWTLGAGVERAFSNNMTARLEYRYTDLGSDDFDNGVTVDSNDVTIQSIRAGLSYKF